VAVGWFRSFASYMGRQIVGARAIGYGSNGVLNTSPLIPSPFHGTSCQDPRSRARLRKPGTTFSRNMQLTTAVILAFAASAVALVVPCQEAQPPLPCKNFKQARFQEYTYGCCSSGAVDCVSGECNPRKEVQNAASTFLDFLSALN
jgi:uncharacterized membrane protein